MKKIIILIFLLTISCSNNKVVKNHGLNALDVKEKQIILLVSNKNDILSLLGSPSSVSLFDENLWYYFERELVNQSVIKLGKTKLKKNTVLEISFNQLGIAKSKKIYNIDNMNDIKSIKETTVKKYDKKSKFGKLLKSMEQKINSPKKNVKK